MTRTVAPIFVIIVAALACGETPKPQPSELRISLVGLRPGDASGAVAFGAQAAATVAINESGKPTSVATDPLAPTWGSHTQFASINLAILPAGRYELNHGGRKQSVVIGNDVFRPLPDVCLEFMRQQRCGYNPYLDAVCHPFDGRSAYGPAAAGTFVDTRGGWHDAGDLLKYLLTSSNATAQMLLAYRLSPGCFADRVNALGQPGANGTADVLDEAKWGLEWMLKLHPSPEVLYHQVADDRDHSGWVLPHEQKVNYGWGPGSYRVAYAADGKPQGLGKFQSDSTGIANLAGRYAAAMALAHQIWKDDPKHGPFARRCLQAGLEVYRLGRAREGVQQGNSFGAPYRYAESTWADDMEWGAAELFRSTGEKTYLDDAIRYARLAGAVSWMGRETAKHYEMYPFFNAGHFALYDLVGDDTRRELAGYYRTGLDRCRGVGESNPFEIGVPFIWCSNNLVVALATQANLYERMTGDPKYRRLAAVHRDWLFGRNPWGTSMVTGVPEGGTFPREPHLMTTRITKRPVRGGLVDGPVAEAIFKGLKGVKLTRPDPFAAFQSERAVYHDDVGDYSTNEPTMDGTASLILLLALQTAR